MALFRVPYQSARRIDQFDPFQLLLLQRSQGDPQFDRRADFAIRDNASCEGIPIRVSLGGCQHIPHPTNRRINFRRIRTG